MLLHCSEHTWAETPETLTVKNKGTAVEAAGKWLSTETPAQFFGYSSHQIIWVLATSTFQPVIFPASQYLSEKGKGNG